MRIRRNSKEFGDSLENLGEEFGEGAAADDKTVPTKLRRGRPQRDPALYEMKDYL